MTTDLIAGLFFGIGFCVTVVSLHTIYENIMQARRANNQRRDDAIAQLKSDVLKLCDEMKKKNSCTKKA